MNDFIWLHIGLVIIACIGASLYKLLTGKLPPHIDRDGDGKVF